MKSTKEFYFSPEIEKLGEMKFCLMNDSMCYNDARMMGKKAVERGGVYKARVYEYKSVPHTSMDTGEIDGYRIYRKKKHEHAEKVGVFY